VPKKYTPTIDQEKGHEHDAVCIPVKIGLKLSEQAWHLVIVANVGIQGMAVIGAIVRL
jgi:hypothetical protein